MWTYPEPSLNLVWTYSEPPLNILWTYSEPTLNLLWTSSEPALNILWTCSEPALKICPRIDKISKTLLSDSLSNMDQRDASATKNQDITHWINDQLSGHCYQFTNFYPFPPPLPSTPHYFIRNWIKGNNVKAMQEFAFPSLLPLRFSSPSCPSCLLKFYQNYEICSKFLVIHPQTETPVTDCTDLCKRDGGNLLRC